MGAAGMTPFGWFHTAISIVAVVAGIVAFVRYKQISTANSVGMLYVLMTVLSCVTGLFIFHHGGFGPGHVLAIVTLVVLALAWSASISTPLARYRDTSPRSAIR